MHPMSMIFAERLARAQRLSGSLVCVGLDPDPAKLPLDLRGGHPAATAQAGSAHDAPLYAFNRRIVDATAHLAATSSGTSPELASCRSSSPARRAPSSASSWSKRSPPRQNVSP